MPTRWDTFPIELTGGLVSNLSRLQHGIKMPGSARRLINFEPSIKGGYRRINGFSKFSTEIVPHYGTTVVQGSGQTGTTLNVADIHEEPSLGSTFTISGVTGTYTVSAVAYNDTNKTATITLSTSLASSPADKADLTFTSGDSVNEGIFYQPQTSTAYVLRAGVIWSGEGGVWTKVSTPDYGTVLVNGAGQTGTTLAVDGLDSSPVVGDTFSVAGIEKVYTVTALWTLTSGAMTVTITPALASSPADNAAVTFRTSSHSGASRARFAGFNFNGTFKVAMVDGTNYPAVFTPTTYKKLVDTTDILGSSYVTEFKDHLFFAKDDLVTFSVPFNEDSFDTGLGAGSYRMPSNLTGLIVFRDQLISFSERDIKRLTGSSVSDFQLLTITSDLGCVEPDTIQEVGGDVLFLGPDGVRFLGATDRIGDFNLSVASRQVQDEFLDFVSGNTTFCSTVVRAKNQYRIFRYSPAVNAANTLGYIGTQFMDQTAQQFQWAQTEGFKCYRITSQYDDDTEVILFVNDQDYVYRMESGSDFDGTEILSSFFTPYMSVNDPRFRKVGYKLTTYLDPEGAIDGDLTLKYDFNDPNKIQPDLNGLTAGNSFSIYGSATYGTSLFGGRPETFISTMIVGSFFTVSLQYDFNGGPPFVIDTVLLEYSTEDRK